MIETIMYVGIGFLVASLLVIGFIPLVHGRAVRLTMQRLEAATPMSMAEIQADKDQLAGRIRDVDAAAGDERRAVEGEDHEPARRDRQEERGDRPAQARARREDRAVVGPRSARQGRPRPLSSTTQDLEEKTATCSRPNRRWRRSAPGSNRNSRRRARSRTHDRRPQRGFGDRRQPARRTGRAPRPDRGAQGPDRELRQGDARTAAEARERGARTSPRRMPTSRRSAVGSETLSNRIAELERTLVAQTTEAEILGRRVQEVSSRLDEQGRFLAEREYSSDQLRNVASDGAARPKPMCAPNSPRPTAACASPPTTCAPRRRWSRASCGWRRTSSEQLQREIAAHEAAGRVRPGPPSAWKTRCCASASTTSRPKSRGSPARSKARARRSTGMLARSRPRPCRRQPRERAAADARPRRRKPRHARRPHPRPAKPRLGGVIDAGGAADHLNGRAAERHFQHGRGRPGHVDSTRFRRLRREVAAARLDFSHPFLKCSRVPGA